MTRTDVTVQVERRVAVLLATPGGRARTAEYLARLEVNQFAGMAEFVDQMLRRVAPQWAGRPEERNARFEALKDTVRAGGPVDDAVSALVDDCPARVVFRGSVSSSPRRPRLACETTTGGTR